jgi:hypothetical protein
MNPYSVNRTCCSGDGSIVSHSFRIALTRRTKLRLLLYTVIMKPRNPTDKKQIAYKKDHVYYAEYPHTFRKTWPRKKAFSKRAERHKVREKLILLTIADDDNQGDFALKPVRRKYISKWVGSAVPLGESVKRRLRKRGEWLGWNLLKVPYSTDEHRDRFVVLLESVTRMEGESARGFAEMIAPVLLPGSLHDHYGRPRSYFREAWLRSFFADAPEWEPRLRAWVEKVLAQES